MLTERPIPGQSLTTTPKNAPYERPPELTDPTEALDLHLDNLVKDGVIEDVLYFLEKGVDLQTLVEGILRSAVMEGMHSVDISLIIAPIVHEYIRGIALETGTEFKEGFEDDDAKIALSYERDMERAQKILSRLDSSKKPDPMSLEDTQIPDDEKIITEEEPVMEQKPEQGLMARRMQ